LLVLIAVFWSSLLADAFSFRSSVIRRSSNSNRRMGLYDDPLPPRPPPRKEEPKEEQDDSVESTSVRLFEFNESGKERRNLLPPLSRRLDSGIDCYFEETDRLVINLVDKTGCNVEDACWALEACKGDITEAWTRISTARRVMLNQSRKNDDEFDEDSLDIEMQEEFEKRKMERIEETKQRRRDEYRKDLFKGGEPDQQWLPTKNPNPIDDEPWFTG